MSLPDVEAELQALGLGEVLPVIDKQDIEIDRTLLGRGGFGAVHRATVKGKPVAAKILDGEIRDLKGIADEFKARRLGGVMDQWGT